MKCLILSGYLHNLSDNIIPFLDTETDVHVHTWYGNGNERWVTKLNRYKKYCGTISNYIEKPKFNNKLYSYFYSSWKAVNSIKDIDQYSSIIKFKPNLDSSTIQYEGNLEEYFHKAYIQSKPLLSGTTKEECLYGSIYYQTMDERMFSGYPLAFKKAFHILYEDLYREMVLLDSKLIKQYGEDYEGSIFWMKWFDNKGVKLIQDLNLKLPNNKTNE